MSDPHLRPPRTLEELAAWQAQEAEPILDPGLPIIDAHHHMWERAAQHYGFSELAAELQSGHNVCATVFIECSASYRTDGPEHLKPIGETEWVNTVAAKSAVGAYGTLRLCAGIVGAADLTLGERVRETLEAHLAAGGGRFRGVRQQAQYDAVLGSMARRTPPQYLLRDEKFRAGVRELARLGLALDVYVYFTQLDEVAHLARSVPEATIILNHAGTPLGIGPYAERRDEVFAAWSEGLSSLARCSNVVIKLGGLGMAPCGFGFESLERAPSSEALAHAWQPYVEAAISAFGAERAMFESNFPIDKQSCSYSVLWNAFKRITQGASDAERHALFAANAARIYRLVL